MARLLEPEKRSLLGWAWTLRAMGYGEETIAASLDVPQQTISYWLTHPELLVKYPEFLQTTELLRTLGRVLPTIPGLESGYHKWIEHLARFEECDETVAHWLHLPVKKVSQYLRYRREWLGSPYQVSQGQLWHNSGVLIGPIIARSKRDRVSSQAALLRSIFTRLDEGGYLDQGVIQLEDAVDAGVISEAEADFLEVGLATQEQELLRT